MPNIDCAAIADGVRRSIAVILLVEDGKVVGKGSGFVYRQSGVLVTCNHVVNKSGATILLKFADTEETIRAKVAIRDEEHDIALLTFADDSREPLQGVSEVDVKEGMPVALAGFPLTLMNLTTHQGVISAILEDATGVKTYLIDGTVNSGNSGCPLLDSRGRVVGVVNATRRESSKLLEKIEDMEPRAIALHGVDLVEAMQAIISNLQLGIGYAIPCSYIPERHGTASKKRAKKKTKPRKK